MKVKGVRIRWSAERFAAVSSAQRASGLSVQAYCLREGINLSSFYRWRDRAEPVRGPARRAAAVRQTPKTGEFIALPALPMSTATSSLTLKFDLGGGLSLTVSR
jgi:transposase-like protein